MLTFTTVSSRFHVNCSAQLKLLCPLPDQDVKIYIQFPCLFSKQEELSPQSVVKFYSVPISSACGRPHRGSRQTYRSFRWDEHGDAWLGKDDKPKSLRSQEPTRDDLGRLVFVCRMKPERNGGHRVNWLSPASHIIHILLGLFRTGFVKHMFDR
ncbi:hypothetical protein ElyMa_002736100 [Elysia marginata]|uniref:Uncharacterized protein n=1 Tax=Elysia marginata TaxID=1093978 RepID=A0AAV4HH45_9GAST|nr:hypothetical protein ElyMa_002736100 [Elysia marginata]